MRIGIFLGYGPQVILGKEGLGRYLGTLLKGFQEGGHEVVLCVPYWQRKSLQDLFNDFSISNEGIQWIVTEREPVLWRIYKFFFIGAKNKSINSLWYYGYGYGNIKRFLLWIGQKIAETDSNLFFIIYSMMVIIPMLFGVSFGMMTLFGMIVVWIIFKVGRKFWGWLLEKGELKKRRLNISQFCNQYMIACFRWMERAEQKRLVRKINRDRKRAEIWFIPSLFWPEVLRIRNGIVVLNVPDLIPELFPMEYADADIAMVSQMENVRTTLEGGRWFITYGDYIRNELLLRQYQKQGDHVVAIMHANNDMMPYVYIPEDINERNHTRKNYTEAYAKSFLGEYANVRYIFYASQARPNKNILNLLRAFEYLLRRRFLNIKLVLTASLGVYKPITEYILEHHLEREVISFYNVPAKTLAALYYCAELVVNPTFYEGGFPFTFGEGMSVGTPSIMSDIPQTREVLEPAGLEEIMFDPYDWKAMAEKIEYALAHKNELYKKELPLYQEMARRTPCIEAKEYVEVFQRFLSQEAAEKA